MASDEEQLVLSISADTRQIMNAIKRLEKAVGTSAGQIEKSFSGIGKGIDKSTNTTVQQRINEITGVGVQATKQWTGALADQARDMERMRAKFNPIFSVVTRYKASVTEIQAAHRLGAISVDEMTNAISRERQAALASIAALKQRNAVLADRPNVGGSNFNTANIAAQFQDIGVTAAMGMSPLQIALQQGTQLSAVLNGMGNAKGVIAGLGSAFATIVNPVSLVTIGVVGLTAAAIQYFSTFMSGSNETEKALKAQADLIQRVAEKWGDALPALKAYADEQRKLADQAEIKDATAGAVEKAWAGARSAIQDTRLEMVDLILNLQQAGAEREQIAALQQSFEGLLSKVADGTVETEDLQHVSEALASLFQQTHIPIVSELADRFKTLADQIAAASAEARKLDLQAATKLLEGQQSKGGRVRYQAGMIDLPGSAPTPDGAPNREDVLAEQARRASRASRGSGMSEAEKQKKAIDDVVASLKFEQDQLGRTTVEQRVYNELKRAGVDLNSKTGQQIASMVSQIETERAAIEANTKAREAQAAAITNLFEMAGDAIVSMVDGSDKAGDAIKRLVAQLALAAAQAALLGTGPLAGLFGGGGLFGGAATSAFIPGILSGARVGLFAKGTNSAPGGLAIVGEEGPELVNLPRGAQVIPTDITRGILSGPNVPSVRSAANQNGGGLNVTYAPVIDARGADAGAVARIEKLLQQDKASFKGRVVEAVADARRRNVGV